MTSALQIDDNAVILGAVHGQDLAEELPRQREARD